MNEIDNIRKIERSELVDSYYFESLIDIAKSRNIIDNSFIDRIQYECFALLADKCKRYTAGYSSSVRAEISEELMKSVIFTLGVWLKEYPEPDAAIEALGKISIKEGYNKGFRKICTKIKSTKRFYELTKIRMLITDNYTYSSTLTGGIEGFFKSYNPEFFAHRIHITADYQVVMYPSGYQGIEFIQHYLQAWNCENRFCNLYDSVFVDRALTLYAINYSDCVKEMVFNLYSVVLSAALACIISEDNSKSIPISDEGKERIKSKLIEKKEITSYRILLDAMMKIKRDIVPDRNVFEYMSATLDKSKDDIINNVLMFADYYE